MKVKILLFALAAMLFAATANAQFVPPAKHKTLKTDEGVVYFLYGGETDWDGIPRNLAMLSDATGFKGTSYEMPNYIEYDGVTYTVRAIGCSAFEDMLNLESVKIANNVTTIHDVAFSGCSRLKTIESPRLRLDYIGLNVFRGTPWLKSQKEKAGKGPEVKWKAWLIGMVSPVTSEKYYLPAGLKGVCERVLDGNNVSSKTIVIPSTLTHIGYAADYQTMENLEKFEVHEKNETFFTDEYGVLYRTFNPFDSDYEKYKTSGRSLAVYPPNCKLTKYTTARSAGGEGVRRIDGDVFKRHRYLKDLIVSEGVIRIGSEAIRDIANLKYLQLPYSIVNIDNAISGCSRLDKVVILSTKKPFLSKTTRTFERCSEDLVIYVPTNLLEEYKADEYYTRYAKEIRAIDSQVVGIGQAKTGGDAEVKAIYSTDGTRLNVMQKGVNIVKMSDGTVRKVVRK